MRPSEALERHRDDVLATIARMGASNPRVFGSVARGDDTNTSDLDLVLELPPDSSYLAVFEIEDALSLILGCKVEVHTAARPESRFAQRIGRDLKPL